MSAVNLKKEISKQKKIINRLKRKIKKLEDELSLKNNIRANNQKTRLRVKDIIEMYPVAKSTIWYYVKKGYIKPIKNSSRVTTFDAKEIKSFFKSINKEAKNITPKKHNVKTMIEKQYLKPTKTTKVSQLIINSFKK